MSAEYFYEQVALMLHNGRSAEYIASRLGKTVKWVEDAAADGEVIARCNEMRGRDKAEYEEAQLWDRERIGLEIKGKTPRMLAEAEQIATNPNASDNNKLKAIEIWLKYNEEMPKPKEEGDGGNDGFIIDGVFAEALLELAASRSERRQLTTGNGSAEPAEGDS